MQDLWQYKMSWDESIPPSIQFATQLDAINQLSIDHTALIPEYTSIQIHGFCDVSKIGYGACIYLRSRDQHNNVRCYLLCAKNRVVPLKNVTISRLELCGAHLLAKLYDETRSNETSA